MIMSATPPTLGAQIDALIASGRFGDAYRLLTSTKAARDPQALFTLAAWRLGGDIVRRDLAASRDYFRRAAECGHPQGARIHVNFVANGTGGNADWGAAIEILERMAPSDPWARAQLDIIGQMDLSPSGDPVSLPAETFLSDRPQASSYSQLFTATECAFLIGQAGPALQPSLIIDPQTGCQVPNPIRTSDSTAFPFVNESPAIHALNRRIAALTETNVRHGEPMQVLRYRPGQEYRAHFDAVGGTDNQRILTVLVYLNEGYGGGETAFVRTGLSFKGQRGDALVFHNALPDGRPDEFTQHAGLPVTSGEKLICSRWIRQREFLIPPPAPLLAV